MFERIPGPVREQDDASQVVVAKVGRGQFANEILKRHPVDGHALHGGPVVVMPVRELPAGGSNEGERAAVGRGKAKG